MRARAAFLAANGSARTDSNRALACCQLSATTTGEAINAGMWYGLLAVAPGVLCDIRAPLVYHDTQYQDGLISGRRAGANPPMPMRSTCKRYATFPAACLSWIGFNLIQIEPDPL